MNWFSQSFRKMHHCFCIPDWVENGGKDFNAREYIKLLKEAHVDCVEFYAKDHLGIAYFNTQAGKKSKTRRDYLREILNECQKNKIKVIAYYSALWERAIGDEHPEWVQLNSQGKRIKFRIWWQICPNSDYKEIVKTQLKEIAAYGVDGIWLDMLVFGNGAFPPTPTAGCYCETCKRLFYELNKCEMPLSIKPGSPEARPYYQWRFYVIENFLKMCYEAIKEVSPSILFIPNFTHHLTGDFSYKSQKYIDVVSLEGYTDMPIWQPGATHLTPSIVARYAQNFNKPSEVLISRLEVWWNWAIRNKEQLTLEVFSVVANGSSPTMVDRSGAEAKVEPTVYKAVGEIYKELEELEPWLINREPLVDFAILYSEDTANYRNDGSHRDSFFAACKMMLESHLLFEIVTPLSLHRINAKALILPEVECLSRETIDKIKDFINSGGKIIFSSETSLYNERAETNSENLLTLFGIIQKGKTSTNNCFLLLDNSFPCEDVSGPLLIKSEARLVEAKKAKSSFLPIIQPQIDVDWDHPVQGVCGPPAKETGFNAILLFDQGVYFSIPIFYLYALQGEPVLRDIVRNIGKKLLESEFEISAPPFIEVTAYRKEEKILLHLLNHQQCPALQNRWQPRYDQVEVPVEIFCRKEIKSAYELPSMEPVIMRQQQYIQVKVLLHKMLLLDF